MEVSMRIRLAGSLALFLAALSLGCQSIAPVTLGPAGPALSSSQTVSTTATVRHVSVEGGTCWGLATPRGSYQPVGLAAQYQVDGLRVAVVMRGVPRFETFCMMAPLVSLDSIRTLREGLRPN